MRLRYFSRRIVETTLRPFLVTRMACGGLIHARQIDQASLASLFPFFLPNKLHTRGLWCLDIASFIYPGLDVEEKDI